MGPFTALMTVDHAVADHTDQKRLSGRTFASRIAKLIQMIRAGAAKRRLRDQLADMDHAMLKDIGIADDEIHMIRNRQNFTPRAWAGRSMF